MVQPHRALKSDRSLTALNRPATETQCILGKVSDELGVRATEARQETSKSYFLLTQEVALITCLLFTSPQIHVENGSIWRLLQ